jgi:hypothetical protein
MATIMAFKSYIVFVMNRERKQCYSKSDQTDRQAIRERERERDRARARALGNANL